MIPNIENYYRLFTSIILTLFTILIKKVVDNSLKNQNIRIRKSELSN